MGLALGSVVFTAFEVPSVVRFGGSQSLAVHQLPGGVRVVDALGSNDSDITWQGVLSGAKASDRARELDAMRIAGQSVALAWDEFVYTVVIDSVHFAFCNSWWIPYKISCVVTNDPSAQAVTAVTSVISLVASDVASASGFFGVAAAVAALSAAGSSGAGTASYAVASQALLGAAQMVNASIQNSETALGGISIQTIMSEAGVLASAVAARGYIERAITNYAQVAF